MPGSYSPLSNHSSNHHHFLHPLFLLQMTLPASLLTRWVPRSLGPSPLHQRATLCTVLQTTALTLTPAIIQNIKTSLTTCTLTNRVKQAQVTKASLTISFEEGYRPVSLLPFLTKTLKSVVFNQISTFPSLNNLLDVNQSFYRNSPPDSHRVSWDCKSCSPVQGPNPTWSVCSLWHLSQPRLNELDKEGDHTRLKVIERKFYFKPRQS